jgi:hypothetical protein
MSLLVLGVAGCRRRPYDFQPLKRTIESQIELGTTPNRATSVLDSLGVPHTGYVAATRKVIGSLREPEPGMVFSTLRVVLSYDQNQHLVDREVKVVFTGP